MPKVKKKHTEFLLCITDLEDDLQKGKLYKVLPDESAAKTNYIRVVDESGEDYLYPAIYFVKVELPLEAKRAMLRAS